MKFSKFLMPFATEGTGFAQQKFGSKSIVQSISSKLGMQPNIVEAIGADDAEEIFESVISALSDTSKSIDDVMESSSNPAFAKFVKEASKTNAFDNSKSAMIAYNASVGTASGSVGKLTFEMVKLKAASIATNMAISFGVTAAFTAIAFAINYALTAHQDSIDKMKTLVSDYKDTLSELDSKQTKIDGFAEEYEKLSKGVGAHGKNISLTTDEYTRYNEIVNQIASMFPTMVAGYSAEGDAILKTKGNVEELTKALEEQRRQAAIDNLKDMPDVFKGVKNEVEDYESDINSLQNALVALENGRLFNIEGEVDIPTDVLGTLKKYGISTKDGFFDNAGFKTEAEEAQAINTLRQHLNVLLAQQAQAQSEINQGMMDYLDYENLIYSKMTDTDLQGAIKTFATNVDFSELGDKWSSATDFIGEFTSYIVNAQPEVQQAFKDLFSLDPNTLSLKEYKTAVDKALATIATDDNFVDLSPEVILGAFNLDTFESDIKEFQDTIRSNIEKALASVEIKGELKGLNADDIVNSLGLDNLKFDQLATLNNMFAETGEHAADLAIRLYNLAKAGAPVSEIIDQIGQVIDSSGKGYLTVGNELDKFKEKLDSLPASASDTQEALAGYFDEFKAGVDKGQLNTERMRELMKLLIGDTVSLAEAQKWIKENEGFFKVDKDGVALDVASSFETLHKKYKELDEEQRKTVDSLMSVDWDSGAIMVAQNDVEALAKAFGVSHTVLQQFFDLISSYGNSSDVSISTMKSDFMALNDAVYELNQSGVSGDANAWNSLGALGEAGTKAKLALESVLGADFDYSSMTVDQLTNVYDGLQGVYNKASEISGTDFENLSFGDLVSTIESVQGEIDGLSVERVRNELTGLDEVQIKVDNLQAFADAFNIPVEAAQKLLETINEVNSDGNVEVSIDVNTEAIENPDEKAAQIDAIFKPFETEYNVDLDYSLVLQADAHVKTYQQHLNDLCANPYKVNIIETTTKISTTGGSTGDQSTSQILGGSYAGTVGSHMAAGGKSIGGKVLVGELGRELWISRDGKRQKIVGKNGMEVINIQKGDAIVPNNLTEGLIRGGMSQACGGANITLSGGVNDAAGSWYDNVKNSTKGRTSSSKSGSSKSSKKSKKEDPAKEELATLRYLRNMELITEREYYDRLSAINEKYYKNNADFLEEERALNEELYKLKKELHADWVKDREHELELMERNGASIEDQIALLQSMQEEHHKQAEAYRAYGLGEDSEPIQGEQTGWWSKQDKIDKLILDDLSKKYEDYIDDRNTYDDWGADNAYEVRKRELADLDDCFAKRLISEKAYQEKRRDLEKETYQELKSMREKELDDQKKMINGALAVVDYRIDKEVDALNAQIKALREKNDEIDRAIELEKLQEALVSAKRNKNLRVYYEDKGKTLPLNNYIG